MSRFREGQVVENQQGLDYFLALKGQKGPEELCRGGVQRSTTKRGRKPRRWGGRNRACLLAAEFYALTLCVLMSSPTVM